MSTILKGNNSVISGNTTFTVRPTFGNNTPWDSGNFNPSNYAPLTGSTFTGPVYAGNTTVSIPGAAFFANESANTSGSKRASIQIGSAWQPMQDINGNGTRDFGLWNSNVGSHAFWIGANNEYISFKNRPSFNGYTAWDSGNFNPANYYPLTGGTINGDVGVGVNHSLYMNGGTIITDYSGNGGLRLVNGGVNYSGYIGFYSANTSAPRHGYIGYGTSNGSLIIAGEDSAWTFNGKTPQFTNGLSVTSGSSSFTVRPTFNGAIPWDTANQPVQPIGQCRLVYTSATSFTLMPCNGNQIFINGAYYTIPSGGVSSTTTGMTVSTLFYIYAYANNGSVALGFSTTGHTTSAYGHEVMSGSPGYTLVGMVSLYNDGKLYDTPGLRLVASYFNRKSRHFYGTSTSATTTSASYVELNTANRVWVVTWGDEAVRAGLSGYMTSTSTGVSQWVGVGYDGTMFASQGCNPTSTSGWAYPVGMTAPNILSEGIHYITPMGTISGGATGQFAAGILGDLNQ